eukprot:COSAG02_NODE_513_length_20826_cov_323.015246_2_plen_482_part_00
MAYNLRTGLIGSGDIDVNVSLGDLNAANVTAGIFDIARIPVIGNTRVSDLDAAKLTGTLNVDRLSNASIPKAKINEGDEWAETEIPTLPKTKIQSGANTGQWDLEDLPNSIPTSKLATFVDADIPNLDASKITTGNFINGRLPTSISRTNVAASNLLTAGSYFSVSGTSGSVSCTSVDTLGGTISCGSINSTGTIDPNNIASFNLTGSMNAGYFTLDPTANTFSSYGGTLTLNGTNGNITCADIDLNGNDIVDVKEIRFASGTGNKIQGDSTYTTTVTHCDFTSNTNGFSLDASKITSGTLHVNRLPFQSGIIAYKALAATGGGLSQNTIGSNYEVIDSNLQMSFVVPASGLVEVELTFYAQGVNTESLYAQLVWGGTNSEYASYQSLDSPSTANTIVISKGNSDHFDTSFTVKWVLQYPSSAVGYGSGNIDAQLKMAATGQSVTVKWTTGTNTKYQPVVFKATALPSTANLHIYTSSGGQ